MASYNRVTILGNLGNDPELRYTQKGKAVCNLSVATSWKPKEGPEQTEWHRVVVWDSHAENCGKYLKKGRQVFIDGRIASRKYEKDGQQRIMTEIVADRVIFIDNGERRGGGPSAPANGNSNREPGGDDDFPPL